MNTSIRLNEREDKVFREYAAFHGITLSELIKESVWERIEDEIDLRAWDEAYDEYKSNPVTFTLDEVAEELGIDV